MSTSTKKEKKRKKKRKKKKERKEERKNERKKIPVLCSVLNHQLGKLGTA
jgi:hypothetical protein